MLAFLIIKNKLTDMSIFILLELGCHTIMHNREIPAMISEKMKEKKNNAQEKNKSEHHHFALSPLKRTEILIWYCRVTLHLNKINFRSYGQYDGSLI